MSNQSNRSPEAYNNSGCAHARKGDYEKAIVNFNQAIRLNPKLVEAYHNRGFTYGRRGDYQQAIVDYDKAIELNPNFANAYNHRGLTHYYLGLIACQFPNASKEVDYFFRGQDHFKKAMTDYRKAIRLRVEYPKVYFNRVLLWLIKKDWEKPKKTWFVPETETSILFTRSL